MRIEEMKNRKRDLGYSNQKIAELSGVPLGTVQKIFSGETRSPRYETLQRLEKVLAAVESVQQGSAESSFAGVREQGFVYGRAEPKGLSPEEMLNYVPNASPTIIIGACDGKYKIPADFDYCNDEIAEMFGVGNE